MFEHYFELLIVFLITLFFLSYKKPNLRFLFYGYISFLLVLLFTFPLRYLGYKLPELLQTQISISIFLGIFIIIFSEVSKYLTLKKILKIKSSKNAVFFGIGWSSLESLNFITIGVYSYIFSFFLIEINPELFMKNSIFILPFLFILLSNLAITTLVILSVIKKRLHFLILGILYAIFIYSSQIFFKENQLYLYIFISIISLIIIYKYNIFLKKFK